MASLLRVVRLAASASILLLVSCLALTDTPDQWPCSSNDDCSGNEQCVPTLEAIRAGCSGINCPGLSQKTCRDPLLCGPGGECPVGHTCNDGRCSAHACGLPGLDASVCGAYRCDERAFLCHDSCEFQNTCASGFACSLRSCVPYECNDFDSHAPCNGYQCQNKLCRRSCFDDKDCVSGHECVQGKCLPCTETGCGASGSAGASGSSGQAGSAGAAGASGKAGAAGTAGTGGAAGSAGTGGAAGKPPVCDPVEETGCKKGEKCMVHSYTSPDLILGCVTAGPRKRDESCYTGNGTDAEDCASGLLCTTYGYVGDTFKNPETCKPFCRTDGDCPQGSFCASYSDDVGIGLCVPSCTPFKKCDTDYSSYCSRAYLSNETGEIRLGCRAIGPYDVGDPCSMFLCKNGLACVKSYPTPDTYKVSCEPLCDETRPCPGAMQCLSGDKPCPAGQVCLCQ